MNSENKQNSIMQKTRSFLAAGKTAVYFKRVMLFLMDILLVSVAILLATALRYDLSVTSREFIYMSGKLRQYMPYFVAVYMFFLLIGRTYTRKWRYAGITDMIAITLMCALGAITLNIANIVFGLHVSRMVLIVSGILCALFCGGIRLSWRAVNDNMTMRRNADMRKRVLIVGTGESAAHALNLIKEGTGIRGVPIGFIGLNPAETGTRLHDLPILGTVDDIESVAVKKSVTDVIIALGSENASDTAHIVDAARKAKCDTRVLSAPNDINDRRAVLRDPNTSDFLARSEVKLENAGIKSYIAGKTVLVTGGGGSIGSEICRQVMKYSPGLLIVFDIYENCAYELEVELKSIYGQDCPVQVLIGSIRDRARLDEVFDSYNIDIVFHAAAHKHVPLMETSPAEAIKNNIFGTRNLLESASAHNVERLVQLSTDKAVNPTSVMGATKRVTEMLIQRCARDTGMKCMAVRFGNVLGSHGSVIPLFTSQIQRGGPVTLTDVNMTRFVMTIPEAAQLVLQAGALCDNGSIYVLDMGKPMKMIDIAESLIRFYGYTPNEDMKIEIIGLRKGEKLYEELMSDDELKKMVRTAHDKIMIAPPIPIDDETLEAGLKKLKTASERNDDEAVEALRELVPSFTHGSL